MNLEFIEIKEDNSEAINIIYNILKSSGEYLYNHKQLYHWKTPYSKELIKYNIKSRRVYLVKDIYNEQYVHTFQLDITKYRNQYIAEINKFATIPSLIGKGIGSKSIKFIEEFCMENEINKIRLEVYDKSVDSVNFYKSKSFFVVREKKTKYFNVLIMEKLVDNIKNLSKD